jgi:hypothetical protein
MGTRRTLRWSVERNLTDHIAYYHYSKRLIGQNFVQTQSGYPHFPGKSLDRERDPVGISWAALVALRIFRREWRIGPTPLHRHKVRFDHVSERLWSIPHGPEDTARAVESVAL